MKRLSVIALAACVTLAAGASWAGECKAKNLKGDWAIAFNLWNPGDDEAQPATEAAMNVVYCKFSLDKTAALDTDLSLSSCEYLVGEGGNFLQPITGSITLNSDCSITDGSFILQEDDDDELNDIGSITITGGGFGASKKSLVLVGKMENNGVEMDYMGYGIKQ